MYIEKNFCSRKWWTEGGGAGVPPCPPPSVYGHEIIYSHVESFYKKSEFYLNLKKFWVVQNSFPITEKLIKIKLQEER